MLRQMPLTLISNGPTTNTILQINNRTLFGWVECYPCLSELRPPPPDTTMAGGVRCGAQLAATITSQFVLPQTRQQQQPPQMARKKRTRRKMATNRKRKKTVGTSVTASASGPKSVVKWKIMISSIMFLLFCCPSEWQSLRCDDLKGLSTIRSHIQICKCAFVVFFYFFFFLFVSVAHCSALVYGLTYPLSWQFHVLSFYLTKLWASFWFIKQ